MNCKQCSWLAVALIAVAGPTCVCLAQITGPTANQAPRFANIPVIHAQMDAAGQTARLFAPTAQPTPAQLAHTLGTTSQTVTTSGNGPVDPQSDHSRLIALSKNDSGPIQYGSDVEMCSDCACEPSGGFMAGVDATYLRPSLDSREIVFPGTTFVLGTFDWEFESAPRVWVSWQDACGLGLRARYWQLDAEADPFDQIIINPNPPGIGLNEAHSNLEFYTIDLEVTASWHAGCWSMLTGVGARHGSIAHQYVFKSFTMGQLPTGPVSTIDTQFLSRRFDGIGITLAQEAVRPLGHSPFSLVFNARGSALRGYNKASNRTIRGNLNAPNQPIISDISTRDRCMDTLLIGELQLGIEWTQGVSCCGGGVMFARVLGEAQIWDLCEVCTTSPGDSLGTGDVGLYGFTASVGFQF